jgi:hypothetical protein
MLSNVNLCGHLLALFGGVVWSCRKPDCWELRLVGVVTFSLLARSFRATGRTQSHSKVQVFHPILWRAGTTQNRVLKTRRALIFHTRRNHVLLESQHDLSA